LRAAGARRHRLSPRRPSEPGRRRWTGTGERWGSALPARHGAPRFVSRLSPSARRGTASLPVPRRVVPWPPARGRCRIWS